MQCVVTEGEQMLLSQIRELVSRVGSHFTVGLVKSRGMANRAAPALVLRLGDREKLERTTRSQSTSAGIGQPRCAPCVVHEKLVG